MCGIFTISKNIEFNKDTILNEFNKSKNRGGIPPDDTKFIDVGKY